MVATVEPHLSEVYADLVNTEPRFADLVARFGTPDPFDFPDGGRTAGSNFAGMVMHILAQQIATRVALVIFDRLVAATGGLLTPEAVLRLDIDQLKAIGTSHSKAVYVRALAEAVASGTLDIAHLELVSDIEAEESLTQIKGIGPWSAEMFLLHQLRRGDILPAGDLGIRAAIRSLYALPEVPSIDEVRRLGATWKPYRSYAAALLWRSLSDPVNRRSLPSKGITVHDLHGFASERLSQLAAARSEGPLTADWLIRQLVAALRELDSLEPVNDAALERREDF